MSQVNKISVTNGNVNKVPFSVNAYKGGCRIKFSIARNGIVSKPNNYETGKRLNENTFDDAFREQLIRS